METIALSVQARNTELPAKKLRKESTVPCVLYGFETDNTQLQCDHNTLMKAFVKAGENTVVELDAAGKTVPVLFHAIDFDPVTEKIIHVDFYAVNMKQEIEANIPLHFVGVAPAVKDLGGVLVTALDHVAVRCLPANLPHAIDVDISSLETYDDVVHVSDAAIPDNVTLITEPETTVATVQQPRRATEEAAEEAAEGEEGEAAEGDATEGEGDAKKEE